MTDYDNEKEWQRTLAELEAKDRQREVEWQNQLREIEERQRQDRIKNTEIKKQRNFFSFK